MQGGTSATRTRGLSSLGVTLQESSILTSSAQKLKSQTPFTHSPQGAQDGRRNDPPSNHSPAGTLGCLVILHRGARQWCRERPQGWSNDSVRTIPCYSVHGAVSERPGLPLEVNCTLMFLSIAEHQPTTT